MSPQMHRPAGVASGAQKNASFVALATRVAVGHTKAVTALAWNCTGTKLITGGDTTSGVTLRVFDTERLSARDVTGDKDSDSFSGHTKSVEALVASPLNPSLFASAGQDNAVHMYDMRVHGGTPVQSVFTKTPAVNMAWSPDSQWILVGGNDESLYVLGSSPMAVVRTVAPTSTVFNQTRFSVDGKIVLRACGDGTVKVYSWPTMRLMHELRGHRDRCFGIAVDPNGQRIAVSSDDACVTVWDASTLTSVFCVDRADHSVRLVDYSHDGSLLASASVAGNIDVTAGESGAHIHSISTPNLRVVAMQWHPTRSLLAYCVEQDPCKPPPTRNYGASPLLPMQTRAYVYGFSRPPPQHAGSVGGYLTGASGSRRPALAR
jgi:THO complex subunit 3